MTAPTFSLPAALAAWNTPDFTAVLKRELETLGPQLPLQQGLATSSYALDDTLSVMVIAATEQGGAIHAHIGVFFSGIVAGCNCADDPTPVEPQPEYLELLLVIARGTAAVAVTPLPG